MCSIVLFAFVISLCALVPLEVVEVGNPVVVGINPPSPPMNIVCVQGNHLGGQLAPLGVVQTPSRVQGGDSSGS